jgi:hypothetical protein
MVELQFKLDEVVLREDREANIREASAGALEETYFVMPVRFKVGTQELLEIPARAEPQEIWVSVPGGGITPSQREQVSSPWLPLPLLDVATVGRAKVREAWQTGEAKYDLPGGWSLHLRKVDGDIFIKSDVNQRVGQVAYQDLMEAFDKFRSTVRDILAKEVPELKTHHNWEQWFTEQD